MADGHKKAQVWVTESSRSKFALIGRLIEWATKSKATHTFVVTEHNELVEAWFPWVKRTNLSKRIKQLHRRDRAYAILELPDITPEQQELVSAKADSYRGRFYNVLQAAWYGIFRDFLGDKHMRSLICSRLITAAYYSGINVNLFTEEIIDEHFSDLRRVESIRRGYVIPSDLLTCKLKLVAFNPSERIKEPEDFLR